MFTSFVLSLCMVSNKYVLFLSHSKAYSLSTAPVPCYHKVSGLKQHRLVILQLWSFTGPKWVFWNQCFLGDLGRTCPFLLWLLQAVTVLPASGGGPHSLVCVPFAFEASDAVALCSASALSSLPLYLTLLPPYMRPLGLYWTRHDCPGRSPHFKIPSSVIFAKSSLLK